MSSAENSAGGARRAAADRTGASPVVTLVVSWLCPGAGHLLQGQAQKAAVFFVALVAMFACGVVFGGRLFPFQWGDPLVFLAAAAEWGLGFPRVVALLGGLGQGQVTTATYEYGNTFLIASGLLNTMVALNAFDLAVGPKAR